MTLTTTTALYTVRRREGAGPWQISSSDSSMHFELARQRAERYAGAGYEVQVQDPDGKVVWPPAANDT